MGDQFTELEALKDQIATALNDKDPQKHKGRVLPVLLEVRPGLCKRFKVRSSAADDGDRADSGPTLGPRGRPSAAVHFGCTPGDWHPSRHHRRAAAPVDLLRLGVVRAQKQAFHDKSAAVDT